MGDDGMFLRLMHPDPVMSIDKGVKDGSCNRTQCQKPGATWYNKETHAYYCPKCAKEINHWGPEDNPLCIPPEE
jgi:hypothetical protein